MIFLKEIQNEIEAKASLLGIGLLVVLCVSAGFIGGNSNRPYSISAFMQVLAGMCRPVNVPHALDRAIQKFEKSHPHVRVEYENGIPQSDYSDWLSEKIVSGKTPDVFMVSEQDLTLLAARGSARKVKRLYGSKRSSCLLSCCL